MKKIFFSLLTLLSVHLFAQDVIVNDANAEKRALSASFNGIKVSDGIDLMLTQGSEESLAVSASEPKYLEKLKTEIVDGMLNIYYENAGMIWNSNQKRKLKAYVSFKTLEKLQASSGATIKGSTIIHISKLELKLSSGAIFTSEVNITQLTTMQDSGAEIYITGKTSELTVEASSGAIFKGYELVSDYCKAKASSGGSVRINVEKELNAKANSGGGIHYKGNAVIKEVDISSGGSVKRA